MTPYTAWQKKQQWKQLWVKLDRLWEQPDNIEEDSSYPSVEEIIRQMREERDANFSRVNERSYSRIRLDNTF